MDYFLKNFDILSIKPHLYFKQKRRYYNIFGFISSIILYIILILIFIYELYMFLYGKIYNVTFNKEQQKAGDYLSFDITNRLIAFKTETLGKNTIDETYLKIKATLWSVDEDTNIQVDELENYLCKENEEYINKHKNSYDLIPDFLCLKRKDNKKIILEQRINPKLETYINIYLLKCENSTLNKNHCKTNEEIEQYLNQNIYIRYVIQSVGLNHGSNGDPFIQGSFSELLSISSEYINAYYYQLRKTEYISNSGYIIKNKIKYIDYNIDSTTKSIISHSKDKKLYYPNAVQMIQFFIAKDFGEKYERTYNNISNVIVNISSIRILVLVISKYINRYLIEGLILNTIFNYLEPLTIKKYKFNFSQKVIKFNKSDKNIKNELKSNLNNSQNILIDNKKIIPYTDLKIIEEPKENGNKSSISSNNKNSDIQIKIKLIECIKILFNKDKNQAKHISYIKKHLDIINLIKMSLFYENSKILYNEEINGNLSHNKNKKNKYDSFYFKNNVNKTDDINIYLNKINNFS